MYAIVKTGGKQYRVEQGQWLLVERLPVEDGAELALEPLLYVDGSTVVDGGEELAKVKVSARVLEHPRGPKLRVVKFKPKRGYKRRNGHRQALTRIEVTSIELGGAAKSSKPKPVAAVKAPKPAAAAKAETPAAAAKAPKPAAAAKAETAAVAAKADTPAAIQDSEVKDGA